MLYSYNISSLYIYCNTFLFAPVGGKKDKKKRLGFLQVFNAPFRRGVNGVYHLFYPVRSGIFYNSMMSSVSSTVS